MCDGALVGTFLAGSFCIDVYPLVVECGVSKEVDTLLVNQQPVGVTEFLAQMRGKFFV